MDEHECINGPEGCEGVVELRSAPPTGERSFMRCEAHAQARWDRYEGSLEQEAQSPMPPAWLDPSFAGEAWDE